MGKSQGGSNGRQAKNPVKQDIHVRIRAASKLIPYNRESGYFASPGKNSGIRNFHSNDPHVEAHEFAERLANGWTKQDVEDGWKATNGKLTITYRSTTRTESDFPAVDIRWNRKVKPLTGLKSQRVHFLGGVSK